MAPSVFYPPSQLSPASALALSQQAPAVLRSSPASRALFSAPEKPELWIQYESLIISCLRTGDEDAANECLRRLLARFGPENERVQALNGLIKEAEASNNGELDDVLKEYNELLSENETNIVRCRPFPSPSHAAIEQCATDQKPLSSLSRRGASRCCGRWGKLPRQPQSSCSFSNSRPPMARLGPNCRISTSARACIHKRSTPWKRSWYWRPMHGMYAIRPWLTG